MTWLNPPPIVEQFRAQLEDCPCLVAIGMTQSRFHYPSADPTGDNADPMPFCVIADLNTRRTRYAEGTIPLVSGTLAATIYVDEDSLNNVGDLETLGRQLLIELGQQFYGIPFKELEVGLASDLSPGQRSVGEDTNQGAYRTIQIKCPYGLNRG